jgi:bacteriocin-like protein
MKEFNITDFIELTDEELSGIVGGRDTTYTNATRYPFPVTPFGPSLGQLLNKLAPLLNSKKKK